MSRCTKRRSRSSSGPCPACPPARPHLTAAHSRYLACLHADRRALKDAYTPDAVFALLTGPACAPPPAVALPTVSAGGAVQHGRRAVLRALPRAPAPPRSVAYDIVLCGQALGVFVGVSGRAGAGAFEHHFLLKRPAWLAEGLR
jgi:hypothetical protein